jgi:spore coat polysaccharide biosynthesis protein SpsF
MLIIMQGRIRSTRLPAKGFLPFFGQTVWERMCDIGLAVRGAEQVVFATGNRPENQLAKSMVEAKGVRFFAGSEENTLERFCQIAEACTTEFIVRMTCDNYLIQPDVIEGLYTAVHAAKADYGNIAPLSHYGGEVIRRETLLASCRSGRYSAQSREHVTWDIREDAMLRRVVLPPDYLGLDHEHSVTLDTVEDFIRMKHLERTIPELRSVRCLEAVRRIH